jgi:hypothetical protein
LILLGLNIGLVVSSIFSFLLYHSVTGLLAVSGGIVGGITLFSRFKVWKSGTLKNLYDLARDSDDSLKKLRVFDTLFWAVSVFNTILFLWYLVRK